MILFNSTKYGVIFILLLLCTLTLNAQYLVSNNCGSGSQIEVKVKGIKGQNNPSFNIGNISTTNQLIVTVWIEANSCSGNFPNNIQISNGGQVKTASQTNVTQSPTSNVAEKIYRVTINNPTSQVVSVSGMGTCTSTSMSVQKVKVSTGNASYARAINQEFHNSSQTYSMNIGNASITRNIQIQVPIHEKDNNGRIARVEVTGNGISMKSAQITNQNQGDAAGLIIVNVPNVPASTSQLNIKIISPAGSTGESFGVGVITSATTSPCCAPPSITPYVRVNNGSWIGSTTVNICAGGTFYLGTQTGLQNGMVIRKPNGSIDNTPNGNSFFTFTNATTSNSGTYTITYTDNLGCSSSKNYTVTIITNYTNGGTIAANQTNCGSFNPPNITSSAGPSGGSGGTTQYQWQYRNGTSGTWVTISGATSATYNPGTITQTRQYRRGARRSPCTAYVYSNVITKTIVINYTSGGTIGANQTNCGSFDPPNITVSVGATGGSNVGYEVIWEYRNGTSGAWTTIVGATNTTYNPPLITQTRQYRRGVRRSGCLPYIYSNVITKTVSSVITKVVLNTNKSEYCSGETATLTATITGGSSLSYSWQYSANGTTWTNANSDPNSATWNLTNGNLANTDRWWRVVVTGNGGCSYTSHSVKTTYIGTPNVTVNDQTICNGSSATLTATGYDATAGCFDLADYSEGVDQRAWTGSSSNSNITVGGITHWTGCGRTNWYDIQRIGAATGYAEYQMQFTAQDWTNFQTITVNQCQSGAVRYRLYVYDNNGWRDLGFSGTNGGTHTFNLPTPIANKDDVSKIIIRVFAADLAVNQTVRFHLNKITGVHLKLSHKINCNMSSSF
jgi:hypothetical protein